MKKPTPNAQRTEAMRAKLIRAARMLFVDKGFAETSTPDIVKLAEVTRGALYHHFADKTDLFRAVVRQEFELIAKEINTQAIGAQGDALAALMAGTHAYLETMRAPGRVRLLLQDAPAVLSRAELDQMDLDTSGASLKQGLAAVLEATGRTDLRAEALAPLVSAMFDRAALDVSQGASEADCYAVFEWLFTQLCAPPDGRSV
ncbi:MAG: TetR/AcrR family transcriptional regulator [Pseudomonadota bacterium]